LSPRKRIDQLLRAFGELSQSYNFTLLVVGRHSSVHMSFADARLHDGGRRSSNVPPARYWRGAAAALLGRATSFVPASRSEGGPVAIMEAMASGLPIIATPVGATFEVMVGYGPGGVLPLENFRCWPALLRAVLEKGPQPPLDRELAATNLTGETLRRSSLPSWLSWPNARGGGNQRPLAAELSAV